MNCPEEFDSSLFHLVSSTVFIAVVTIAKVHVGLYMVVYVCYSKYIFKNRKSTFQRQIKSLDTTFTYMQIHKNELTPGEFYSAECYFPDKKQAAPVQGAERKCRF